MGLWKTKTTTYPIDRLWFVLLGTISVVAFLFSVNKQIAKSGEVDFVKTKDPLAHTQGPLQLCYPTSSYSFSRLEDSGAIILKSHYGLKEKIVGGDEFYPTIMFKDDIVVAVGHVSDLSNGEYSVEFKSIVPLDPYDNDNDPSSLFYTISLGDSNITFSLKNILQFSCRDGLLPPPAKEFQMDSGAVNREVPVQYPSSSWLPVEKSSQPTQQSQPQIDLKKFDRVLALGDSLMEQLVQGGQYAGKQVSPPWMYVKIQAPLSSDKIQKFITPIRKSCENPFANAGLTRLGNSPSIPAGGACSTNRTLLLLNSGVWDLLEDGSMRAPSISKKCCNYDADFEDHLSTLRNLLSSIRREFPNVAIGWKSMTAVHVHRADCRTNVGECRNRTKYMSSSRSYRILKSQMELLEREFPDVLFANIYDVTYSQAHHSRPGDGRHYCCKADQSNIAYRTCRGVDVCLDMWNYAFGDSGWA